MKHSYVLFYKPYNVLCQFTDNSPQAVHRQTLKDFIPIADIYSVGRLDRDSEGLLLLTDDNQLKHRLCDPKFAHPRTYWVQVENIPDATALNSLRQGVDIKGQITRPAIAQLLTPPPVIAPRNPPIRDRKNIPTAWLELVLTEGRNRQVRRMTAAVGYPTLRLIRVAIGPTAQTPKLTFDGLTPGQWRYLSTAEIEQFTMTAKPSPPRSKARPSQSRHRKKK